MASLSATFARYQQSASSPRMNFPALKNHRLWLRYLYLLASWPEKLQFLTTMVAGYPIQTGIPAIQTKNSSDRESTGKI
jgi:hypothetical protein